MAKTPEELIEHTITSYKEAVFSAIEFGNTDKAVQHMQNFYNAIDATAIECSLTETKKLYRLAIFHAAKIGNSECVHELLEGFDKTMKDHSPKSFSADAFFHDARFKDIFSASADTENIAIEDKPTSSLLLLTAASRLDISMMDMLNRRGHVFGDAAIHAMQAYRRLPATHAHFNDDDLKQWRHMIECALDFIGTANPKSLAGAADYACDCVTRHQDKRMEGLAGRIDSLMTRVLPLEYKPDIARIPYMPFTQ